MSLTQEWQAAFDTLCQMYANSTNAKQLEEQARRCYNANPAQGDYLMSVLAYWGLERGWLEDMIAEAEYRTRYMHFREQLKTALHIPDTDVNTWEELTNE